MANEELRIENKEKLLNAAFECFLEMGIADATQSKIAKKSGVSLRTLNRVFENKTDCVLQSIAFAGKRLVEHEGFNCSLFSKESLRAIDLLREYLFTVKRIFINDPRLFILYAEYSIYLVHHENELAGKNGAAILKHSLGYLPRLTKIFKMGEQDKTIRESPMSPEVRSELFANIILSFLAGTASRHFSDNMEMVDKELDRLIERWIELYSSR